MWNFRLSYVLCLLFALASAACGDDGDEHVPPLEAAATPSPAETSAPRLEGTWKLSLNDTLEHWPDEMANKLRAGWLTFRAEEPTDAELDQLGGAEKLVVAMGRAKRKEEPNDPGLQAGRERIRKFLDIRMVVEGERIRLITPNGGEDGTFAVASEAEDGMLIEITESDGTIANVEISFRGRDRILMEELEGEAEGQAGADGEAGRGSKPPKILAFVREGSEAADQIATLE